MSQAPDFDTLTQDDFLGGRLRLWQPRNGFRAGLDSVLLAAAIEAKHGDHILEMGCGCGVALICAADRLKNARFLGVDSQEQLIGIAKFNIEAASLGERVSVAFQDVLHLSGNDWRGFDQVFCNPPFFQSEHFRPSPEQTRDRALRMSEEDFGEWLSMALRCLAPAGTITLIQRIEALPFVLNVLGTGAGDIQIIPIYSKPRFPAIRFILRARKGRKGAIRFLPPLILHEDNQAHSFSQNIQAILREGKAIHWGDDE